MSDFREEQSDSINDGTDDRSRASMWPGVVIIALIVVAGVAIVYAHGQKADINAMAARDASLNANVAQLQNQLQTTTAKLNDVVEQQQAQARAAAQAQAEAEAAKAKQHAAAVRSRRAHVYRRHVLTAAEKRYNAVQARLDAQQKELNDTNQSIAQTRSALQASLDSTRTDLNGSIARNHGELVALEKRGLRNYVEFDLYRSKEFSRTGPISLDLRHADTKHSRYNVMLLVDDNRLEKKNVDLYEPIWISSSDEPQPLEIVVNKITKNHIHGYISAPKYSSAQLASDAASLQPVSASSSGGASSTVAASGSAASGS
ncbi:MAG TPA: hypothetical protein VNK23_09835, partial [Candidatus Dormibacteraeota bacterium]|nr:hypothetical protein [Candidatus Dormibacteraeota bacterium]